MYKQVLTIIRGITHTTTEEFTDRHALPILQQQIRDSARAVASARRAVAIAIAQSEQEREQDAAIKARIRDLEDRVMAALEQDKMELAREAAEMIAVLEADAKASSEAQARFASEIDRLKQSVRQAEAKLLDLQRGQRLASATQAAQNMQEQVAADDLSSLADAEATLMRLQRRQREFDLTARAHADLDGANSPARMSEKLAEAGCGVPLRSSADDVIARLNARRTKSPEAPAPQSSS